MGRRNRRGRHAGGDHGDDDDALEREWTRKRQKTTHSAAGTDDQHEHKEHNEQQQQPKAAEGEPPSTGTSSSDQIDRLRAKKQAQKQRRKEKNARRKEEEAARADQQQKQTLQQQKAKAEQEKKAKQKQKPSSQQFHTLRRNVQYRDLVVGRGPAVQHRKKCRVRYVLRTKSHISGKILDSSQSFAFRLGKGEVIAGWDIGMDGMRVGGVRRLIVSPEAGYGNKDIGGGRGAVLYFEIELLHVAP